jgi:hypothetical protein
VSGARSTLALAALVLGLSGCGSDDEGAGAGSSATPTTPATGQAFEFTGYVFRVDGETRICDAIRESHPPQCGGESYRVLGLQVSTLGAALEEAQGVSWTDQPVMLTGELVDDGRALKVSAPPGGGPPPPTVEGQPGSAPG